MQDGPAVRLSFALMAPVVPLLVLSSCLLEIFSTGSGITAMQKAEGSRKSSSKGQEEWHEIKVYSGRLFHRAENCPSDFFKLFVRVGEKQGICGWPRISCLFISNLSVGLCSLLEKKKNMAKFVTLQSSLYLAFYGRIQRLPCIA